MVPFALFGQHDLAFRRFLCLLGETIRQNNQPAFVPEAEQAEGIATELGPHLPQIIRPFQLLKVLPRHSRQLSHRAQHPQKLLRVLRPQRIKKFLYRACPGSGPVELDFQHLK